MGAAPSIPDSINVDEITNNTGKLGTFEKRF
jgi:hypothetical protein